MACRCSTSPATSTTTAPSLPLSDRRPRSLNPPVRGAGRAAELDRPYLATRRPPADRGGRRYPLCPCPRYFSRTVRSVGAAGGSGDLEPPPSPSIFTKQPPPAPTAHCWKRCAGPVRRPARRGEREVARRPDVGGPDLHPTAGACGRWSAPFSHRLESLSEYCRCRHRACIAREIRASAGGLTGVKGYGRARAWRGADISMNITDFRQTPLSQVYAAVGEKAARFGVGSPVGRVDRPGSGGSGRARERMAASFP